MLSKYMRTRGIRREARTLAGRFRGGKLAPVMAVPFRESESGSISQSIVYELDPIAGRMITAITAEVVSVFVPVQAIDALKYPEQDYPGNSEVVRQKLLSGAPLFDVEEEGEISQRLGVVPRSVGGTKYVSEAVRLAHNAAVNYLRQRKYTYAALLDKNSTAITPALISQTVLDRLNGVLDPEDRVNGAVNFDLGEHRMVVQGITRLDSGTNDGSNPGLNYSRDGEQVTLRRTYSSGGNPQSQDMLRFDLPREDESNIFVDLSLAGSGLSLTDFYKAEKMDRLTREMRRLVDEQPVYGEELVARFAHGLSVDVGKHPFVVYEQRRTFGMGLTRAMDGDNLDVTQSNLSARHDFTVPIPATEFGGILITFAAVKPDETIASQPHPILSTEWGARNYVADEMAIDPVPVTIRELDGDCDQEEEETVALYVGNNSLLRTYLNYGFNRHLDPETVEAKTAIWQLEVPMSVTPESILYPDDLSHYPFADQLAEVCTYTVSSMAQINTPIIFGPTPVEELAAIEDADIFEDAPESEEE